MLTIEIPTDGLAVALTPAGDDVEPGPALAAALREVADRIERDIRILPGHDEWTTETYWEVTRLDGVLLGATITLSKS